MKKKGFTLVELLAVIVILAIIALITIPLVIKTINNSEIEGEKQSIAGYARAIEDDIANYMMINPGNKYENYTPTKDFDYKGNKVFCFSRTVSSTGKLTLNNCYVSDKELTDEEIKEKNIHLYKYENGKVDPIEDDKESSSSANYKEYKVGDQVTVASEKYYVIAPSNSTSDYVTALKANPLTVDEINTYGAGHVNMYNTGSNDSIYHTAYDFGDSNHTGGMAYYSSADCGWGTDSNQTYSGCTTSYAQSEVKYVIDAWSQAKFTNGELKTVDGYGARLVTLEELKPIGWPSCASNATYCSKETDTPSWIYNSNYWYWTMSQYEDSSYFVWFVVYDGSLYNNVDSDYYGAVRPVLNIYKSKIQN